MPYHKGQWSIICDVCGFEFLNTEVKKRWDGLIVCEDDFETDHPQKYLRVRSDGHTVNPIREEPEPIFIVSCTVVTNTALADYGTADCMTVGNHTLPPGY